MAMELVTGYAGKAHVTSYQDAAIQAGIVGVDNGVLSYVGQGMKAVATSANNIRIYDGVALIGGKAVVIDRDTYQDVAIANGTVGKYRNDIIYIKYTKDAFTGVESVTFDVKQGAAGNSRIDPALTTNNLYSTGTLTSEIPFKRVRLNGLAIESVENMHDNVPSLTELNRKLDQESSTKVMGFSFLRRGNEVLMTHNSILEVVEAGHVYTNQGSIPMGYRPVLDLSAIPGLITDGNNKIRGTWWLVANSTGSINVISSITHSDPLSYVTSASWPTSDVINL
ncbi:MAG: hypothetical protein ACLSFB_01885 [[Clostridium] scindens]